MKINEIITEGPPKGSPFFSAKPRINKQWVELQVLFAGKNKNERSSRRR